MPLYMSITILLISIIVYSYILIDNMLITKKDYISAFFGIIFSITIIVSRILFLYQKSYYAITALLIITLLILSSIKDIKHKEIPIEYIITTFLLGIIIMLTNPNITIVNSILGLLIGFIIFALSIITHNAIGQGDALIIGIMGGILGYSTILGIMFFAFIFSSLYGSYLIFFKRKSKKTKIPFIPFLLLGTLVVFLV